MAEINGAIGMQRDRERHADEAIAALPAKIRVGAFAFAIHIVPSFEAASNGRYAQFSSLELTIRIQERFAAPEKVVDTLLHEVNHAIWWSYGMLDEDKEERHVGMVATAYVALFRDNPWLLPWIQASLSGSE